MPRTKGKLINKSPEKRSWGSKRSEVERIKGEKKEKKKKRKSCIRSDRKKWPRKVKN